MDQAADQPLFKSGSSHEDNFYDTIETSSPDYGTKTEVDQAPLNPEEAAAQRKDMEDELAKLEEEIVTLRTVLSAKLNQASELRRKLGISPIEEFKLDVTSKFQNLRQSETILKTESLFKSFGAFASKKFGDVRKSTALKSFGEKVGGAYTNVKLKVSGSKSETNFKDVLDQEPTIAENPADSSMQSGEAQK